MNKFSSIKLLFAGLLAVLLAGCVVTNEGAIKSSSTEEKVAAYVNAAKHYLGRRDFESARRHLRQALELDAKSADVHDALAFTFQESGEFELAEEHFRKAISYGSGASRYRLNYANFLFRMERFAESEKQLQKVAADSLYEKREQALVLLGLCQQQMIQPEAAERSFERALTLNPRNRVVLRQLSVMNFDQQDFQRSWQYLQAYRSAVRTLDPEMLLLGIQLAKRLDYSDAEASFGMALKNLYPESREYQSYLREQRNE